MKMIKVLAIFATILSPSYSTILKVISTFDGETVFQTTCKWNHEMLRKSPDGLEGLLIPSVPSDACTKISPPPPSSSVNGTYVIEPEWIVFASWTRRDRCSLLTKVTLADEAGYSAMVVQLGEGEDPDTSPYSFADDDWDYGLSVFPCIVSHAVGERLKNNFTIGQGEQEDYIIHFEDEPVDTWTRFFITTFLALIAILLAIAMSYCVVQMFILLVIWIRDTIVHWIEQRRINRRRRLPSRQLKKLPVLQWTPDIPQDMCTICLENYVEGEKVRILPCSHVFHMPCIDPWLLYQRRKCPNCKRKIVFPDENYDSDSSNEDERTPLIRRSGSLDHNAGGVTFTFNESDLAANQQPIYRAIHRMMLEANARRAHEVALRRQNVTSPTSSEAGPSTSSSSSTPGREEAILHHAIRQHRLSRFCPRKRLPRSLFGSTNASADEYLEEGPPEDRSQITHQEFLAEATRAYEENLRQLQDRSRVVVEIDAADLDHDHAHNLHDRREGQPQISGEMCEISHSPQEHHESPRDDE